MIINILHFRVSECKPEAYESYHKPLEQTDINNVQIIYGSRVIGLAYCYCFMIVDICVIFQYNIMQQW